MKFNYNEYKEHKLYSVLVHLCRLVCKVGNVHYEGEENIPKEGGFILACNHTTNFDPIALGGAKNKRHIHFMGKEELFENPALDWFLTNLDAFPIKRGTNDSTSIDYAEELIQKGYIMGIFPEGTRNHKGKPGRPKSGVAFIAKATHADVLPCCVYMDGTFKYGHRVTVRFGKLIHQEEFGFTENGSHAEIKEAAKRVMGDITALWEEGHCKK